MEHVILSADNPFSVYAVPDEVARNLEKYCEEFCDTGLYKLDSVTTLEDGAVCYTETHFIEWLNTFLFPEEKSWLVEELNTMSRKEIPKKYRNCPRFNF